MLRAENIMDRRPTKPNDRASSPLPSKQKKHPASSLSAATRALRELARTEASPEHFGIFNEQVKDERNDRGAAILAATNVEIALRYALSRRLTLQKDQHECMFGLDSPLGTFDHKIRIAHALEVFGQQTKKNLDLVRAIRNAFAHAHVPITFETEQVKSVCKFLVIPELLPPRAVKVD